jgi:hypothetical protein
VTAADARTVEPYLNGTAKRLADRLIGPGRHIRWVVSRDGHPTWVTEDGDLTEPMLADHMAGREVYGAYPVSDEVARSGVIDVDLHLDREPTPEEVDRNEAYAVRKAEELTRRGVAVLLTKCNDAGSYHITFNTAPIGAARLGRWLAEVTADARDAGVTVDRFPSKQGGGNAVRLPGRHHKKPDQWSAAWNGAGWDPWPAAILRLVELPDNPPCLFPDLGRRASENGAPKASSGDTRPGTVFDLLVPVEDLLVTYGFTRDREGPDGRTYYTRPGKDKGVSVSVQDNTAWIFSSSVPGLPPSETLPYTPWGLIAHLEFDGDFSETARELARRGFIAAPTPRATLGRTADSETPPSTPAEPPWPERPNEAAFRGLAGDIVRAIEPASEADPVAILAQTLISFGNIIGRSAHFVVEGDEHYANEYGVILGQSSKARKGTSHGRVRRAFAGAEQRVDPNAVRAEGDPTWSEDRNQSGLSSGEGLIWAVHDRIEKQERFKDGGQVWYEPVEVDPGVSDKRLLVYEPEYANVLKQTECQGNTLSTLIRQAWESGRLRSLTKSCPAKATGAHISIIGHITTEELRRYLTATETANGFGNRFLWFLVRRSKMLPEGGRVDGILMQELEERLAAAIRFASGVGEVRRDEEARELWISVYAELSAGRPGWPDAS